MSKTKNYEDLHFGVDKGKGDSTTVSSFNKFSFCKLIKGLESEEVFEAAKRLEQANAIKGKCPWEHEVYKRTDGRSPMMKWQFDMWAVTKHYLKLRSDNPQQHAIEQLIEKLLQRTQGSEIEKS
jgi:hypothetical protein